MIPTAVAAVAVVWAASLFVPEIDVPSYTDTAAGSAVTPASPTRPSMAVLPASTPAASRHRFELAGVMATSGDGGVALISVDGQPARAFRVGATVEGDIVVREVSARGVTLGRRDGEPAIALEVQVAQAPAQATAPVAPAANPSESNRPLYDGSAEARDILRQIGSKHAPLPPSSSPSPSPLPKSPGDAALLEDVGRWPPPSGQ